MPLEYQVLYIELNWITEYYIPEYIDMAKYLLLILYSKSSLSEISNVLN